MLCKDNMASLDYKSKRNNVKHIFPSFLFYFYFLLLYIKGITKKIYHEMHECYAMQILETTTTKKKKKKKEKGQWSQRILRLSTRTILERLN